MCHSKIQHRDPSYPLYFVFNKRDCILQEKHEEVAQLRN